MNNAISAFPIVDAKGRTIEWTEKLKRLYRKNSAKKWETAMAKIPNFKSMNDDAINKWHDKQAELGQKIRDGENYKRMKAKATKKKNR